MILLMKQDEVPFKKKQVQLNQVPMLRLTMPSTTERDL